MANKYIVKKGNEPNSDMQSRVYADMYLAFIKKSKSPDEMYLAVMNALEKEAEIQKQASV